MNSPTSDQARYARLMNHTGGWTLPEYGLEIGPASQDRHIRVNVYGGQNNVLEVVTGAPGQGDAALTISAYDVAKFLPALAACAAEDLDGVASMPGGIFISRHPDGIVVGNRSVSILLRPDEAEAVLADLRAAAGI